jgi:hypothetical protein
MAKKRVKIYYEYPLFDQYEQCPTARFVGGTSKYLCECKDPQGCPGWTASRWMYGTEPTKMETTN